MLRMHGWEICGVVSRLVGSAGEGLRGRTAGRRARRWPWSPVPALLTTSVPSASRPACTSGRLSSPDIAPGSLGCPGFGDFD